MRSGNNSPNASVVDVVKIWIVVWNLQCFESIFGLFRLDERALWI